MIGRGGLAFLRLILLLFCCTSKNHFPADTTSANSNPAHSLRITCTAEREHGNVTQFRAIKEK